MTPGKSVGYQFIPGYGLYWMFQVYPGFATDFNKHAKSVSESAGTLAPRLSRGLMLAHVLLFMVTASMTRMASEPTYRLSNDMGVAAVLISVWLAAIVVDAMVIGKVCDAVNWLADATSAPLATDTPTATSDSRVRDTKLGVASSILALLMLVAFVVMLASRDAASGAGVDLSWSSLRTLNGASTLFTVLLGVAAAVLAIAAFGRNNTRKVFAAVGLGGSLMLLTVTAALMMSAESGLANSGETSPRARKPTNYPRLFLIVENGKRGFIDVTGRVVIAPQFSEAYGDFSEGLALVKCETSWCFIDETGKIALRPNCYYAHSFHGGLAAVNVGGTASRLQTVEGGLWGFIGRDGRYVVNPQYDSVDDVSEGMARVHTTGLWGYIDSTGREVIAPSYTHAGDFGNGLAPVSISGPVGGDNYIFIDRKGRTAMRRRFFNAMEFREGLAAVGMSAQRGLLKLPYLGFIDTAGHTVIDPNGFDFYSPGFSESLACISILTNGSGKYAYIDRTGRMVIGPAYDFAFDFSEGLAAVKIGDKWGYIDRAGRCTIGFQFDHAMSFDGGLADVWRGGRMAYIDTSGRFIWKSADWPSDGPLSGGQSERAQ